jgi:hypothetical protein
VNALPIEASINGHAARSLPGRTTESRQVSAGPRWSSWLTRKGDPDVPAFRLPNMARPNRSDRTHTAHNAYRLTKHRTKEAHHG